jgi:alcohol dehydrogenase, propanol-preferring
MKAMALRRPSMIGQNPAPLEPMVLPDPAADSGQILIRVSVCGVCHTEIDEIEGRTPPPRFPVVPGHQVVGRVLQAGDGVSSFHPGDRAGVAWIYSACGRCPWCQAGLENLCPSFTATGRDVNGGYAELMVVPAEFAYRIPDTVADTDAAPLLCAGAIGYRSLRLANLGGAGILGLMGFGASAHIVLQMTRFSRPGTTVFVFARSETERTFARDLGAAWAGGIEETPPAPPDAIIDTTPAWMPVLASLRHLRPGGRLVINAIRKENADRTLLANCDYTSHLWLEKEIKSVANVTRNDVRESFDLAARMKLRPEVQEYPLQEANIALRDLREKSVRGARVLRIA